MKVRYIYNDINSVNQIYSSMNRRDKIYLNGAETDRVNDSYLYNPRGDFATKYIKEDDFGFMVTMLLDNKPVAFFECKRDWDESEEDYTTKSEISFAVHPKFRHRGIASMIIKHGMIIIKRDSRYRQIEWAANADNKASNILAQKFGFKFIKETISPQDNKTKVNIYMYDKDRK